MSVITAWQYISSEVTVKGVKKCRISMQWKGVMMCCGMAVRRMFMLGVSVRKMKALTEDGDSDTG